MSRQRNSGERKGEIDGGRKERNHPVHGTGYWLVLYNNDPLGMCLEFKSSVRILSYSGCHEWLVLTSQMNILTYMLIDYF